MRRVLVRPAHDYYLQNVLLTLSPELSDRWMEPFVRWREFGATRGYEIDTWDLHPWESADVIVFMDLPPYRRVLTEAKAKAPNARFLLWLYESPLSRPHMYDPRNHCDFDAIVTFDWHLCDEQRYFRYFLPVGTAPPHADPPFSARRPLVMINTNRVLGPMGLFAFRQPGLGGLPGVGLAFRGWSVSPRAFFTQVKSEMYSRRRKIARLAEKEFPGVLEIFGPGWMGDQAGWIHKVIPPRPFGCARAGYVRNKEELVPQYRFCLAYENMTGDVGYISEKMFDALSAGTVPIYLGDVRITDHVPAACFVDARQFRNDREMLQFARDCDEATWQKLREAGRQFVQSDGIKKFQSDAFANRMTEMLDHVMSLPR